MTWKVGDCKYPRQEAGIRFIYRQADNGAKRRKLTFELTLDDFRIIVAQPCMYCGAEPYRRQYKLGRYEHDFVANGVDRQDNNLGYLIDNCVPACGICNRAKHALTQEQWEDWLTRVVTFRTSS